MEVHWSWKNVVTTPKCTKNSQIVNSRNISSSELLMSCSSFHSMMIESTLFIHDGEIWEINSLNYHTLLVQYSDWPSVKEEEKLTNSSFENSLLVNSQNVSVYTYMFFYWILSAHWFVSFLLCYLTRIHWNRWSWNNMIPTNSINIIII